MEKGFTIPVLDHGFVRYVDHMGTDQRIVEAARISFKRPSKGEEEDRRLLEYLYKNKHTSPFEMVKVMVNIRLPIFVMRQYVRHRMQNLNEVSARYSQLPAEFYIPKVWRAQDVRNRQGSVETDDLPHQMLSDVLNTKCKDAYAVYERMLETGVAKEMARMILPLNIYTEIYACWDMKNLLHFISLRDDSHAQAEIQEYGRAIKQICRELFPWTMDVYEKYKWVVTAPGDIVI